MKTKRLYRTLLVVLIALTFQSVTAQHHVVLNAFDVNIRTGPGTDYFVVDRADKGTIFEMIAEKGQWVEIKMFTPDNRFIHRDKVYFLDEFVDGHNMKLPDKETIKQIQQSVQWAKMVSAVEAEEIIPQSISQEHFANFWSIRLDKNIHGLLRKQNIQPAMFFQIVNYKEKN